jgi:predicted RNA-binding Zn-ribbon protein involved in translation (DUF1610 family)
MTTEQINNPPNRNFTMPTSTVINSTDFILAQVVAASTTKKCPECGNNMTGTECADCAKQTVL